MNSRRLGLRSVCWSGLFVCAASLTVSVSAAAQSAWIAVGPEGGDARSFATVPGQPNRVYVGGTSSWIYESENRGATWRRLAKLGDSDDLVLDHIIVNPTNPSHMLVAAWHIDHKGGGVWESTDAGHTWKEMDGLRGQSIRAFADAPSNPSLLVAGTLEGVFRSDDNGATWKQISPAGSDEIDEIESVAIDPVDPNIIYAGTWHLPWKTTDGGRNWQSIKQGLIDDSDVFSIIIDPSQPSIVYTAACSGIYKSENAGELYRKIEGIPSTARRTRVLKQDPADPQVVYAGTTEGLYKTLDGGKTFKRMTGPDVIVNDIFIDSQNPQHVLLATDRSGVLLSENAGITFVYANAGFSARKVEALLVDARNSQQLYAGVVNARIYGGVYASADGGGHWEHITRGLDGRDVFALAQSAEGTVLAGTTHGMFLLGDKEWIPLGTLQNARKADALRRESQIGVEIKAKERVEKLEGRVYALDLSGDEWLASTSSGLLTSSDHGATWQGGPVLDSTEYVTVAAHRSTFIAAKHNRVVFSTDAGKSWSRSLLPATLTRVDRAVFSSDGTAWLGGWEGVFISKDQGQSWQWIQRLPIKDVNDLYFDPSDNKVLVSSRSSDFVYLIDPSSLKWTSSRTGWKVHLIRSADGRLLAVSTHDGVLVSPRTTGIQTAVR